MTHANRFLLAALLLATAMPIVPSAAAGVSAAAATAAADAYEAGAGDDTSATARPVAIPGYGALVVDETHTIDVADATTGDEDWISFTVSDVEADAGYAVLLEAACDTAGMTPVIEVYAPGADPTDPTLLPGISDPAAAATSAASPWLERPSATLGFVPDSSAPGDATVWRARVRPAFAGAGGFGDAAGAYRLRVKFGLSTRLAGPDRYGTAARASMERFLDAGVESDAAVLANGLAFPDALAGSTLAGALRCPLLLTDPRTLSAAARAELLRLDVDTVYVLGGERALAPAVRDAVASLGITVVRISGADRFATAANVARAADATAPAGTAPLAFVVNGLAFADALSASAVAADAAAPVLLTWPDRLPAATAEALADPALGVTDVVIVGGTGAVTPAVEQAIAGLVGADHVRRIAGVNRYATSRDFAVWATGGGTGTGSIGTTGTPDALSALAFSRVGVASGASFPDALGAGVFCGLAGSPLLLTEQGRVSPYIEARLDPGDAIDPGEDYYGTGAEGLGRSCVFGGAFAVSAPTGTAFDQLTGARF